jgi:hypothetical protein
MKLEVSGFESAGGELGLQGGRTKSVWVLSR